MPPANDNLANATLISAPGTTSLSGTTVGSTVEAGTETGDGYVNTVWYRIEVPATGTMTWGIRNASYLYYAEIYKFPGGGTPADFDELIDDYNNFRDSVNGFPDNSDESDTEPVVAGDVFYILVTNNAFEEGIVGTFTLDVIMPIPPSLCVDAEDVIYGSSPTATVVSGNVRETQVYDAGLTGPYESWIGDMVPTLRFAGANLPSDGPGYYVVKIKTKSATNAFVWMAGFRRNGMPLWPGKSLDTTTGSTPVEDLLTASETAEHFDYFALLKVVPIHPDDTLDLVVARESGSGSIDIVEVCFYKLGSATPGPAFDILDVPQYAIGTSGADTGTRDQLGDLVAGKNDSPTFERVAIEAQDFCVTDDGVIWVLHHQKNISPSSFTGPVLSKIDGGVVTTVNDDVEGLGAKRGTRGGGSITNGPYSLSIDTDGEDLFLLYGVDDGLGPGGFRNTIGKVQKYDVSADTLTSLGTVYYNTTRTYVRAEVCGFEDAAQIRVSPAGVPWVAFVDWLDDFWREARPAFVAKWVSGTTWDVKRLPNPLFWSQFPGGEWPMTHADAIDTELEAEDHITGSPTVSTVTVDGEDAIRDTQGAATNASAQFIPAAGTYGFAVRFRTEASLTGGTYTIQWSKNGGTKRPFISASGTLTVAGAWTTVNFVSQYLFDFNGTSDTLEVWLSRSGNVVAVLIDKIWLMDSAFSVVEMANQWGPWYATFVEDAQTHVQLSFCQNGEMGEDPVALHNFATVDPASATSIIPNEADRWLLWQFAAFDGSDWNLVWEHMLEDDAPNHVSSRTRDNPNFLGYGHWHQGLAFATDGMDNYMAACLGVRTNISDEFVCLKVTPDGFEEFTELPPGILGGGGYEGFDEFDSPFTWAWDIGPRSVLPTGDNVWVAYDINGTPGVGTSTIVHAVDTGTGGWLMASENNNEQGYSNLEPLNPLLALSADGETVYMLAFSEIDASPATSRLTFGVYECPIIRADKIPLIALIVGNVSMNFREGLLGLNARS